MRLLEHNLIDNLKGRRNRHKGNFMIQQGCNHSCVGTFASYESQGILVGVDRLHLAFPHGLCPNRHHGSVFEPEAVAHCHFDQLTLKQFTNHTLSTQQLGKLPTRAALAWDFVRFPGTSM